MISLTVQTRSRIVLALFAAMVMAQLFGIAPGLEYLSGAFPTYFHRAESLIILITLFVLLTGSSFGAERILIVTHIGIGALAFYSAYQLLLTLGADAPPRVLAILWTTRLAVTAVMGWTYIGAFRGNLLGWRDAFYSLALANLGFIYLRLMPVFD